MVELEKLFEAGVHFGHQSWRWCPNMEPYIWGKKGGVHLINIAKTAIQMKKAAELLKEVTAEGKPILWLGTKKAARKTVKEIADRLGSPYVVHRWIGGTFTNNTQVKKCIKKLFLFEEVLDKSDQGIYTKKEYGVYKKNAERYQKKVGGIRNITWPVGAIVLVDIKKEITAVKEAISAGIPTVAIVDTNSDPLLIDYPIPGNDDTASSIEIILSALADEVEKQLDINKTKMAKEKAAEKAKAAAKKEEKAKAEKEAAKVKAKVAGKKEEKPAVEKKAAEKEAVKPKAKVAAKKEEKPKVKTVATKEPATARAKVTAKAAKKEEKPAVVVEKKTVEKEAAKPKAKAKTVAAKETAAKVKTEAKKTEKAAKKETKKESN